MINPYSFSWGYVEIGTCERCYQPSHLFAHSYFDTCEVRCEPCMASLLDRTVQYNNFPEDMRDGMVMSIRDLPSLSPEKFPIIHSTATCDACERIEGINAYRFIEAVVKDANGLDRTIIVHARCASHCGDCNKTIASPYQRFGYRDDWRVPNGDFIEIRRVDGDDRCATCADTYKQERTGTFYWCDSCEGEWNEDETRWYNGERYCISCIDSNAYECDDCGTDCWSGDDHYCESDDDEDDDGYRENSPIHSYSYRPSPAFFGTGKYHLGFELEVETRNSSRNEGAELAQNLFGGHVYLKDDGSLNDGFEIVTHPHTLNEYQTNFNWDGLNKLKNQGLRSWNTSTCGLHVHVSRTAFSVEGVRLSYEQRILRRQAHELRFMKLIYDNERQVCRIAGRSGNHYASFVDKGKLVRKVKNGVQENGRYSAINTENDDTLEVRVFKGSLRPERVLSALEFVTASVEYTRDLPINGKNNALSWLRFTGYVAQHAETYPNLALIMNESFSSDFLAQQD